MEQGDRGDLSSLEGSSQGAEQTQIKIEINPGKGHADCPCEEGRGKGGAFAESVTCQRPCQGINVNYFESS